MVDAFISCFNASWKNRIIESKLGLGTQKKNTLYKQAVTTLKKVLSAAPSPGKHAKLDTVAFNKRPTTFCKFYQRKIYGECKCDQYSQALHKGSLRDWSL